MRKSIEALLILGYDEQSAKDIVSTYPLFNVKDDTLVNNIKNNFVLLIQLGYTKEDIIKMTKSLPRLYCYNEENIKNKIEFMIQLGYTKEEVIKITKVLPSIYSYSKENISNKIEFMMGLGYTKEDIIKMTKILPSLYSLSEENISNKIEFMIQLGYTKEDIVKMTKLLPSLYTYSEENINNKIEYMISLGYTKREVIMTGKTLPALYCYSEENIKNKIEFMIQLGYTKEEVISMTKVFPSLYSLSEENIEEKINYLNRINMGFVVLYDTKKLMQSTKLTHARHEYLTKEKNVIIDEKNYKKLFYSEKQFNSQYGISKQLLLEMYPYDKKYVDDSDEKIKNEDDCLKQSVNIGTIGYVDHDKTTLTKSIIKELSKNNPPKQLVKMKKDNKGNK